MKRTEREASRRLTRAEVLAMQPGPELDAVVERVIFKREVLGKTTCVFVEGAWSIHPDSDPESWSCYAGCEYVYLEDCICAVVEADALSQYAFGHLTSCLAVVPRRSTQIDAAWEVVKKLSATHWCQVTTPFFPGDQHSARFDLHNHADATNPLRFARGESAAEAIGKAALLTQCED